MVDQGRTLRGSTVVAGVIGSPVRHSRSPSLVNAAFASLDLDWAFVAFEVEPGRGRAAVDAMRTLGLGGLSVTMPHKAEVIAGLDRCTDDALALGAVNCIAWDGTELVGHNTDGAGLVRSLGADHGLAIAGRRCLVLGAGGAGRSVVRALAVAGADQVVVVNRDGDKAAAAAGLAGPMGRVGTIAEVADAEVVINATSVGMGVEPGADGPVPLDPTSLSPDHIVVDLVYQPLSTPLLRSAERRGARAVDGLGMLVHQAALAVELWTGRSPDIDAMDRAARR